MLCHGIIPPGVRSETAIYFFLLPAFRTLPSAIVPTALGLALTLTGDDEDYTIALYCVPVGVYALAFENKQTGSYLLPPL